MKNVNTQMAHYFTHFKMLKKRYCTTVAFQVVVDLLILIGLNVIGLIQSPFFTISLILIVLVKVFITILRPKIFSNLIGLGANIFIVCIASYYYVFEVELALALGLSFGVHLLRIKQNLAEKELSTFYSYPTFNETIVHGEIEKDIHLGNIIQNQFDDIKENRFLYNELKTIEIGKGIYALEIAGVCSILFGAFLFIIGIVNSSNFNNPEKFTSFDNIENGTCISLEMNQLVTKSIESFGDMDTQMFENDSYWGKFNDKYITVNVPIKMKEGYSEFYKLVDENEDDKGIFEISDLDYLPIKYIAIFYCPDENDKLGKSFINLRRINRLNVDKESIIDDKYIQIIDGSVYDLQKQWGCTILIVGVVASVIYVLIFKFNKIKTL